MAFHPQRAVLGKPAVAPARLGFPKICSWTLPTNPVSQRVMEKLGFQYEREFEFAGLLHRFYRLVAGEWKRYDGADRGKGV
jgi:RimJ/RimL family protein N-acetyltransferase